MPTSSLIGAPKTDVDTPALLVDLDLMEANIRRVAETCRAHGVGWRPHTKGQKTVEIIQKELAAGAIGMTCAKLGEAEVLAAHGVRDILIHNQIVGPAKTRRLAALTAIADPIVTVDSIAHVAAARGGDARDWTHAARGDRGRYRHASRRRAAGRAGGVVGALDRGATGVALRWCHQLGEPCRHHRRTVGEGARRR